MCRAKRRIVLLMKQKSLILARSSDKQGETDADCGRAGEPHSRRSG